MNDGLNFYFTWEGQQTGVLVYLIAILVNTIVNAFALRRLDGYPAPRPLALGCCADSGPQRRGDHPSMRRVSAGPGLSGLRDLGAGRSVN